MTPPGGQAHVHGLREAGRARRAPRAARVRDVAAVAHTDGATAAVHVCLCLALSRMVVGIKTSWLHKRLSERSSSACAHQDCHEASEVATISHGRGSRSFFRCERFSFDPSRLRASRVRAETNSGHPSSVIILVGARGLRPQSFMTRAAINCRRPSASP